jgi:hypothetical protein
MTTQQDDNPGHQLMNLLVTAMIQKLSDKGSEVDASTLNVIRLFLSDNSITLAHVKKGNFGLFAKEVAEELPFDEDDNRVFLQ